MSKIIEIRELHDYYHNMFFGYVGIDIETGLRRFYSHYNREGKWIFNKLYEFDLRKPHSKELRMNLSYCHYQNKPISKELPNALVKHTLKAIKEHLEYNQKENYSIENLEKNRQNLCMIRENEYTIFGKKTYLGEYIPVSNTIGFVLDKNVWKRNTKEEKEKLKNTGFHEVGHAKVTDYAIENDNLIKINMGFDTNEGQLEPIFLEDGNIFYKHLGKISDTNHCQKILEEIINDFDCKEANPSFLGKYPNFGSRIDLLCNHELQKARYNHDIEAYYENMINIIKSRDLAIELLETLYLCAFAENEEENKKQLEQAETIIRKYELKKQN